VNSQDVLSPMSNPWELALALSVPLLAMILIVALLALARELLSHESDL